jgi:hypothetical protein
VTSLFSIYVVFGRAPLVMAPTKRLWLFCFSLKMAPTTFGKALQSQSQKRALPNKPLVFFKKANNKANIFRFVVETQQAQGAEPWSHG